MTNNWKPTSRIANQKWHEEEYPEPYHLEAALLRGWRAERKNAPKQKQVQLARIIAHRAAWPGFDVDMSVDAVRRRTVEADAGVDRLLSGIRRLSAGVPVSSSLYLLPELLSARTTQPIAAAALQRLEDLLPELASLAVEVGPLRKRAKPGTKGGRTRQEDYGRCIVRALFWHRTYVEGASCNIEFRGRKPDSPTARFVDLTLSIVDMRLSVTLKSLLESVFDETIWRDPDYGYRDELFVTPPTPGYRRVA